MRVEWSVKDILAHLTFWDEMVVAEVEQILRDDSPDTTGMSEKEIDELNDREVHKRKNITLPNIIEEWIGFFNKTIQLLVDITIKQFNKELVRKKDE